jgi:hypothetical protein
VARGAKQSERGGGRARGPPHRAAKEVKLALEELAKAHAPAAFKALVRVATAGNGRRRSSQLRLSSTTDKGSRASRSTCAPMCELNSGFER